MKDKCIILSRVSTLIQDLVQQTEAVRKQAMADGYEDIVVIEDKESAVKLDEESRLGLTRLKNMILSDPAIKCVYAYELSRIGRRPEVNYNIRNFLQEHRVQLIILSPYMKVFDDDFNIIETSNDMFGLIDLGGRMLRSMGQTSSVDLSTLPEGVYYLRITCKDGYRVVKVIKK